MKVTVGGTMGYKIQGRQYESIDGSSVFTIEHEFPDDTPFENVEKLMDKTTKALEKDSVKKIKAAMEQYKMRVQELRREYF